MEKAVLKTIVAFLNTDGGNLLIGVDDDGDIIGADIQSFENKDKMGLHLTNLIASKIGNSFLPFITFNLSATRVQCRCSTRTGRSRYSTSVQAPELRS